MPNKAEKQVMISARAAPLTGMAAIPGDKSISHRVLILGAMAVGETRISGLLEGQDVLDTARAMRALGAEVTRHDDGIWSVNGVGVGGFSEPEDVIDCGNSGTGVRLLMGAVATTPIAVTFTGDASLRHRPMGRITEPLALFGTRAIGRAGGRLPMILIGAADPVPVRYAVPIPSAQVKSAVLLAALNARGETIVTEAAPTRDHTERMLQGFGADIRVETNTGGNRIILQGQPELRPCRIAVPRDPSSAAFPVAAALITKGSAIDVPGVSQNPTRNGFFTTLIEMGAQVEFNHPREEGGEPVADLHVRFSPDMRGIEVPPERAPSMIDEYPILAIVAAFATGTTIMRGVKELRVKESDRIDAMARGLEACGARIEEDEDTLIVHGMGPGGLPGGGFARTHLDHRIAMSFLVAGMASQRDIGIDDGSPIMTSFPSFEALMNGLGAAIGRG